MKKSLYLLRLFLNNVIRRIRNFLLIIILKLITIEWAKRFFKLIISKKVKYAFFKKKIKKIIFDIEINNEFVFFIKNNKEIEEIIIYNTPYKR